MHAHSSLAVSNHVVSCLDKLYSFSTFVVEGSVLTLTRQGVSCEAIFKNVILVHHLDSDIIVSGSGITDRTKIPA